MGAVLLEEGRIVDRFYSLVKPHASCDTFSSFNTSIHGIRKKDVKDSPEFDEVYRALLPMMEGAALVAHNAPFDMGVLRGALALYGIPCPDAPYLCTVKLSRKIFPELANHKLNTVSAYMEFEFRHHRADEDAEACAQILMAGMRKYGTLSLDALSEASGVRYGQLNPVGVACDAARG